MCKNIYESLFYVFMFLHLSDAFIQSELQEWGKLKSKSSTTEMVKQVILYAHANKYIFDHLQ